MSSGELATMVNGPWAWADLLKAASILISGRCRVLGETRVAVRRRFDRAHNRSSPNADFAKEFLEKSFAP